MHKPRTAMKIRKNLFIFWGLLAIHFFASCVDDTDSSVSLRKECMTLHVQVPGLQNISSYALDAFDECQIETMDVLAFNSTDNKFLYRVEGSNIAVPNSNNPNSQTVDVRLENSGSSNKIYLVLIANARDQVSTALTNGTIATGMLRDDIMNKIVFPCSGKWPVRPGKFTRFPMWGQSGVIDLSGSTPVGAITMIRSVAKIDVGLNYNESTNSFSALPGSSFKLQSITLYGTSNSLQVCPGASVLNSSNNGVLSPSVPSSAQPNSSIEYLVNKQNDNPDKISFTNRIYLAEAAKDAVCLIIGGYYTRTTSEGIIVEEKLMYYRVNLSEPITGPSGEPLGNSVFPVLRNYLYRINITGVNGDGFNSKEEAFSDPNSNKLITNITSVDLSTDIAYNQSFMLGLDRNSFKFGNEKQGNTDINVNTTYNGGWTAKTNDNWIQLTNASGGSTSNPNQTLTFNLIANAGTNSRTGTITISAGSKTDGILTRTVTIEQQAIPSLSVSGVANPYQRDNSLKDYPLTVKSVYPWQVRIKDDPSNILRTFTSSGPASTTGVSFKFSLRNISLSTIVDANATVTFYSPDGAFKPVDVVIRGMSVFDLAGVYVYFEDLPGGQKWDAYDKACRDLPSSDPAGKPWRLPTTRTELIKIYTAAKDGSGVAGVAKYNFDSNSSYWTSEGGSGHWVISFSSGTDMWATTQTIYRARCVRNK